jgi:hypothetical protein
MDIILHKVAYKFTYYSNKVLFIFLLWHYQENFNTVYYTIYQSLMNVNKRNLYPKSLVTQ